MFYIGIYSFPVCFIFLFLYSIYSPLHSIHHHLHLRILKYELKTSFFIYLSITVRQFDVVEESFIITPYNNTCGLYNLIIESPVHLSLFLSGISYNSSSLSPSILSTLWWFVMYFILWLIHVVISLLFSLEHSHSPSIHFPLTENFP